MNKCLILCAIGLCLASNALGQYQTAPAYGNGYQQQRKMAPSPRTYGGQSSMDAGTKPAAGDYDSQSMSDEQSSYGRQQIGKSMAMSTGQSYGGSDANANGYGQKGGAAYEEPKHPPMPYEFGYNIDDGYDNTQYRKENSDGNSVTGSYGYRDSYGVFRYVDYVADEDGFRATVKTNEPGTANEAPADVDWQAEEPPAQTNPGSKSGNYGAGSSSSYSSVGAQNGGDSSAYGMNSGNSGSSYGDRSMDNSAGSGMGSGQQYSSGMGSGQQYSSGMGSGQQYSSGMGSTRSGAKYGSSQDSGANGNKYAAGGSMMSMNAGSSQSYGAQSMGSRTSKWDSGVQSMSSAGARRAYGSAMTAGGNAMNGQAKSMASYGGQSGANAMAQQYRGGGSPMMLMSGGAGGQYGGSASMSMMGAGKYGAGNSMANAGRSSRYKSQGTGNSRMGGYGGMGMGATTSSMGSSAREDQYSMGGQSGDQVNYGSQQEQQDEQQSDSALAQQYGGGQQAGAMDGLPTSTYSSMRLQSGSAGQSAYGAMNAGMNQGYGAPSQGAKMGARAASNYGSQQAAMMMMGSAKGQMMTSNAMDYKKAAAKNIAALVKRY